MNKTRINFQNFNFREEIYDSGLERKFQSNNSNGKQIVLLNRTEAKLGSQSGTMVNTQSKDCTTYMQVGTSTELFVNHHEKILSLWRHSASESSYRVFRKVAL